MELVAAGIVLAVVIAVVRRGRRARGSRVESTPTIWHPEAPSRLRDPQTGRAERGWL